MSVEWRNVYSSNAAAVGYDDQSKTLLVKWADSPKTSAYAGVDFDTFHKLSKAPSVGQMLNMDIKGKYPHRYV